MHDITDLEGRGLPGVFVASREFADAIASQAAAFGFDPARVIVSHPIQDRSDEEMVAIADAAYTEIVAALMAPPG